MSRVTVLALVFVLLGGCASDSRPIPQTLHDDRPGDHYLDGSKVLPNDETIYFAENAPTVPFYDWCHHPDGYYDRVEWGILYITEKSDLLGFA